MSLIQAATFQNFCSRIYIKWPKKVRETKKDKLVVLKHHGLVTLLCREYFLQQENVQTLWSELLIRFSSGTPLINSDPEDESLEKLASAPHSDFEVNPTCTYTPKFVGESSTSSP